MRARIFQRPKTAMQSGLAGTENWVLEFPPIHREVNDPLMGWWGRGDPRARSCCASIRANRQWLMPKQTASRSTWKSRRYR